MKRFKLALLILFILISDQLTKYWARLNNFSDLNTGGAFGVWDSKAWIPISVLLILFILGYYFWKKPKGLEAVGFLIIIFSGISNLVDRLIFGGVIDWIYYPYVNLIGNLADIYLGFGVAVLILSEIIAGFRIKYLSEK